MDLAYSAKEALDLASGNGARSWGGAGETTARRRFEENGFFTVVHTPRFTLSKTDKVFTIGSCFARNVEAILGLRGIPLVLEGHGIEPEYYESFDEEQATGGGVAVGKLSRSAFNKYTAHSISHELRRVLREEEYPQDGLIELGADQWFDPHASGLRHLPLAQASVLRRRIREAMATIRTADVVFITLGLTEGWVDTVSGLAMNRHPGVKPLRRHAQRFRFVDHGFAEIVAELSSTVELVRETCNPAMRFIMTVSPVPLGATWRPTDIVVSNTASKSKLRAVIEEMTRRYPFVDYFPSYEIVVNSPRHLAWKEDQLHVAWPMVQHIMSIFEAAYLPAGAGEANAAA